MRAVALSILSAMVLCACATPARTERDLREKWIGATIEAFSEANVDPGNHAFMWPPEPIGGGKLRYVYSASETLTMVMLSGPNMREEAECTIRFTVNDADHIIEGINIIRSYPGSMANTYCSNKVH
jgi:hypothetical protein